MSLFHVLTLIVSYLASQALSTIMVTVNFHEDYLQQRDKLLNEEQSTFFGRDLDLNLEETRANRIFLEKKHAELQQGYINGSTFLPSIHFFQAKEKIDKSEVFSIIRKIPKGASLHTHSSAGASVDFIIQNITYRDHLYGGYINDVFKLKFMTNPDQDQRCNWTEVKQLRQEQTPQVFDKWLRKQFMLNVENPSVTYPNLETVWKQFKKVFSTVYDLISYKPVFQDFTYQLLKELHDDNILYTELKGVIFPLYDLNGTNYSKKDFFEIFIDTVNKFRQDFPDFLGVKYIHSIYRGVNQETLQEDLRELKTLQQLFPDYIVGIDLVGFEEEGGFLVNHSADLLNARLDFKMFLHAGETNWFGHIDLNLADAILLNSSRIGHAFAIVKHPELLKLAKERDIAIEICPISNQVLKLCDDPRNHPAATLMAINYPLVIGNDDPSIWNSTGLSYDWYVAFMAMTTRDSGLEALKKFALNSINYSSMNKTEKAKAITTWQSQWDNFIDELLQREKET